LKKPLPRAMMIINNPGRHSLLVPLLPNKGLEYQACKVLTINQKRGVCAEK
jgi:hypothetical protein